MRFYTNTHKHYCGIDLHAQSMYLCILVQSGEIRLHQDLKATPEAFLAAVAPYRDDLVVAVECILTAVRRSAMPVSMGLQRSRRPVPA